MADITITDLSRYDGIIAFEEREAKIVISQHFHLHIVDLEEFRTSFSNLKYALKLFEQQNSTQEFHEILNVRMRQLSSNYLRLRPIRSKRGIFNPLGSFIKSITGNLDDNDLQSIKQTLEDSRTNTNMLIKNNQRQIRINDEFQLKINEVIKHVNDEQVKILRKISGIVRNLNLNSENRNTLKGIVHDLIFNIDFLNNQLKDIFESIQLARIGILPKAILSNTETKFAIERLEEQNVTITNSDQIYEFINVETHHEKSKIIFIVKIPIFLPGLFKYIKFETIPKESKIIATPFNVAIVSREFSFATDKECLIVEQYRICKRQELTNVTGDGCIHNALRGDNASCPYINQRDSMDIKLIDSHTLVIRNAIQPTLLSSDCNVKTRMVTGTLLVRYPNCSLVINGAKYEDEKTTHNHEVTMIPTIGVDFKATTIFDKLDLEQVDSLRIENRKQIESLQRDHIILQHTTTVIFTTIVIIIIGLVIWNRRKDHKFSKSMESREDIQTTACSFSADQKSTLPKIRDESSIGGEQLTRGPPTKPDENHVAPKPQPRFMF